MRTSVLLAVCAVLSTGCGPLIADTGSCDILSYVQNTSPGTLPVNHTNYNGGNSVAQSFQLTAEQAAKPITKVYLSLGKQGTLSGGLPMTLTIETDGSSGPSGNLAATGAQGTVQISSVSARQSMVPFTLATAATLAASTRYWLRLKASYGASSANYVEWYRNTDYYTQYADGYAVTESPLPGVFTQNIAGQYSDLLFDLAGC